jgi:leader peptidase (prepilin peptidase) / N-methyltransferase
MILEFLIGVFVFLFGGCVGSFLNCYIYRRLPASAEGFGEAGLKKSLKGRSFCPHCKHTLCWRDLFPVFSFLFLGGKCRYCKAKISWQYPVVEIATGIIFLLIFSASLRASPQASVAIQSMCAKPLDCHVATLLAMTLWFYVASALIVIFVYDLKHFIIPDKVLFPAIWITLSYRLLGIFWIPLPAGTQALFAGMTVDKIAYLSNYLFAVIIAAGFFLAIFLVSRGKWMGFGDVKLAVLMGLLLGLTNVLVALFLAFFFGAIIGIILIICDKKNIKSEIPFGPFLIAGTFMAMLFGSQIAQYYLNLFKI